MTARKRPPTPLDNALRRIRLGKSLSKEQEKIVDRHKLATMAEIRAGWTEAERQAADRLMR